MFAAAVDQCLSAQTQLQISTCGWLGAEGLKNRDSDSGAMAFTDRFSSQRIILLLDEVTQLQNAQERSPAICKLRARVS